MSEANRPDTTGGNNPPEAASGVNQETPAQNDSPELSDTQRERIAAFERGHQSFLQSVGPADLENMRRRNLVGLQMELGKEAQTRNSDLKKAVVQFGVALGATKEEAEQQVEELENLEKRGGAHKVASVPENAAFGPQADRG